MAFVQIFLHLKPMKRRNQWLIVGAALTRKREHIDHPAMLAPYTASDFDPHQIWQLVDDFIEAPGSWLPELMACSANSVAPDLSIRKV
jgi:alpha-galactosidase/6-phospho-beta-glucosidase family protein